VASSFDFLVDVRNRGGMRFGLPCSLFLQGFGVIPGILEISSAALPTRYCEVSVDITARD
jgi:hypothetical protein